MERREVIRQLELYGDAIINYRSKNSRKLKYNVCTLNFNNKYILSKTRRVKEQPGTLLVFCWDTDSFRLIQTDSVINLVPLSAVLKNER